MYLEKLEQDNEKVISNDSSWLQCCNFSSDNWIRISYFSPQKIERSDSNDILGTYFRPRRAAELIHQNKVLNFWKDYSKKNNRPPLNNWAVPTALANNLSNPSSATWQPNSAVYKPMLNGNVIEHPRRTFDDTMNKSAKPYYGVRPTSNVHLNNSSLASNSYNLHKPLNYLHYFNETGDRMLHSLRKPITPSPFLRDNMTWSGTHWKGCAASHGKATERTCSQ